MESRWVSLMGGIKSPYRSGSITTKTCITIQSSNLDGPRRNVLLGSSESPVSSRILFVQFECLTQVPTVTVPTYFSSKTETMSLVTG